MCSFWMQVPMHITATSICRVFRPQACYVFNVRSARGFETVVFEPSIVSLLVVSKSSSFNFLDFSWFSLSTVSLAILSYWIPACTSFYVRFTRLSWVVFWSIESWICIYWAPTYFAYIGGRYPNSFVNTPSFHTSFKISFNFPSVFLSSNSLLPFI